VSLDYNTTIDHNITHILYVNTLINNTSPLQRITLPSSDAFINWFSITLRPTDSPSSSQAQGPILGIQNVRSTTKWMNGNATGANRVQTIEVLLDNLSPQTASESSWLTGSHSVVVNSPDLETVTPGIVKRLRPNDQVLVKVGVRNKQRHGVGTKSTGTASVLDTHGQEIYQSGEFPLTAGIPDYAPNDESLGTHETPDWVI
jgi:alpha-L-fucosidase